MPPFETPVRPTDDGRIPMPGDAVRLTGPFGSVKPGTIGVLGGQVGVPHVEYIVAFRPSIFRGRPHPLSLEPESVSCSGGPGVILRLEEMTPTAETIRVRCWRWDRRGPGKDRDVSFEIEAPLWEWKGLP